MRKAKSESHQRLREAILYWDWAPIDLLPQQLPLLDQLMQAIPRPRLEGWDVLLIQHHLGTFLPLVNALLEDGMDKLHSWHIDIPYSTNNEVNAAIRSEWSGENQVPPLFNDPLSDYSEAQLLRTSVSLLSILDRPDRRRLLVIDDGAYFARSALALERIGLVHAQDLRNVVLVEQTTRGDSFLAAHKMDLNRLGIPAISPLTRTDYDNQLHRYWTAPSNEP